MILAVPCICLAIWALCDDELKHTLLAGPRGESFGSSNAIYDTLEMHDNTVLTASARGELKLWDMSTGSSVGEMQSHLNEVRCIAFSPKQRLLAVGSAIGYVEIWDMDHPQRPTRSAQLETAGVTDCLFSPDGSQLIAATEDGQLVIWEPRTLRQLAVMKKPDSSFPLRRLSCSSDGRTLIAGSQQGEVQVWDLERHTLRGQLTVFSNSHYWEASVEYLAFKPGNQEFLVATRGGGVAVWNLATRSRVAQLVPDSPGLRSCAVSSDYSRCIIGDEAGQVSIWDLATSKCLETSPRHSHIIRALACNDTGTTVVSGDWLGDIVCQ